MKKLILILFTISLIIGAAVAVTQEVITHKEQDAPTELYVLDAKSGYDWAKHSAALIDPTEKLTINKMGSAFELVKIINNHYGTEESKCAQKVAENSIDPVAVVVGNASILVQYNQVMATEVGAANRLDQTDHDDVKALFQILTDHADGMKRAKNPKATDNLLSVFKCTEDLVVLFKNM